MFRRNDLNGEVVLYNAHNRAVTVARTPREFRVSGREGKRAVAIEMIKLTQFRILLLGDGESQHFGGVRLMPQAV